MNAFEQPHNENHRVTPPPPAFDNFDNIDFDAITKEVLAERKGGAPTFPKTHDFMNERVVAREERDKKAANDILNEIKKAA